MTERMPETQEKAPNMRGTLIVGVAWMIAAKWGMRFAGIISMLVLVRLLAPEDFGLFAMVMVVASTVNILFEVGVNYAVITSDDADRDLLDTAWTVRIIQSTLAGAVVAIVAPAMELLYGDDRVTWIFFVVAAGTFLRGGRNIGVVLFQRELEFNREFKYQLLVKGLAVIGTCIAAYFLRDYRALAIGLIFSYCLEVLLSYVMHPYRPRFSLKRFRQVWSFSKWMLVLYIANHISMRLDRLILGAVSTPQTVGYYSVSGEISNMAGPQIVTAASSVLVPGFAKLKNEPERLDRAFLKSIAACAIVGVPTAAGLAAVAQELVPVALGERWAPAIPIAQVLAIFALFRTLLSSGLNLSIVTGHVERLAKLAVGRAILTPGVLAVGFYFGDVIGVAIGKCILIAFHTLMIYWLVVSTRGVSAGDLVRQVWRPLIAAAIMVSALWSLGDALTTIPAGMLLFVKCATGAVIYVLMTVLLWRASGRPDGIERELVKILSPRIRRAFGR